MGYYAVELLEKGIGNRVVGMKDGKIYDVDIQEALSMKKPFGAKIKLQHRVGERALSATRTESCRADESPPGCGTFFASRCT